MHKITKEMIKNYPRASCALVYMTSQHLDLGLMSMSCLGSHCVYEKLNDFERSLNFKYFWSQAFWIRRRKLMMSGWVRQIPLPWVPSSSGEIIQVQSQGIASGVSNEAFPEANWQSFQIKKNKGSTNLAWLLGKRFPEVFDKPRCHPYPEGPDSRLTLVHHSNTHHWFLSQLRQDNDVWGSRSNPDFTSNSHHWCVCFPDTVAFLKSHLQ